MGGDWLKSKTCKLWYSRKISLIWTFVQGGRGVDPNPKLLRHFSLNRPHCTGLIQSKSRHVRLSVWMSVCAIGWSFFKASYWPWDHMLSSRPLIGPPFLPWKLGNSETQKLGYSETPTLTCGDFLGPAMNFSAHMDFWAGQSYIWCSIYSFHLAPRWACAPLQHLCEKSIM